MSYNPMQPRGSDGRWIVGGATRDMLDDSQIAAVEEYRGEGYAELNSGLRSGEITGDNEIVEQLDSVINMSNPEDFTAYRGADITFTEELFRANDMSSFGMMPQPGSDVSALVGTTFIDQGFISVSTNENAAYDFQKGNYSTLITVNAQNLGFADVSKIIPGDTRSEKERILPRGTTFKITSAELITKSAYVNPKLQASNPDLFETLAAGYKKNTELHITVNASHEIN